MRHFGVKNENTVTIWKKLGFYFHFFLRLHVLMDSVNKNPCVKYDIHELKSFSIYFKTIIVKAEKLVGSFHLIDLWKFLICLKPKKHSHLETRKIN